MIGKKTPFAALLLGAFAGSGVMAQSTAPAPTVSSEQRLKQLEQQIEQQQEQNRQILEAIKQMQQGQAQTAAATPAAAAPPAPKKDEVKVTHGWIARIMPVGSDARTVPADELGHFVAGKDSYRIGDFGKESGLRSGADVGWKGEAYLDVAEAGRHTFSINFIQDNPRSTFGWNTACWGEILVEGQSIAKGGNLLNWPNGSDKVVRSVVGGADLEPGRYRVEFWTACGDANNNGLVFAATDANALKAAMNITFEMLVKRPSDGAPVSANKALVVKVQKS